MVLSGGMPGAPGGWMQAPSQVPANCPKGLEYLAQVDQLLVKQKVEALEGRSNRKYHHWKVGQTESRETGR
jgi:hypothetical protein